ncbi:SMI1/KNR4 family protein [Listeria monocytogenes]|uniref:SMI1/KNR4 family protein n=1 Tax=Listeria monocytogenes TaxID=1639 RepID=A0A9P2C1U4_LISMN|nr:SMI1/KNR4 family protein [Listeria monocytogenes]EAC5235057.1 SMI1/KNR4 family protein [Listeria monocytogenes]EAD0722646.1 SMI1/KNR4 family protein [Listeria monocytogenes]EAD1931468.1 SMI1/KNR4 family protein [Listeria monocytogenes]EAD2804444.1 SMI1/KNR4 family protein [Listeria monocytogenes]EAD3056182.1 SMI1/KNR4 family protein [Listeria monocytogenes]
MSIEKYNQAKDVIEENDYLVDDFGGASDTIIEKAQVVLNVNFPEDYKAFLADFGALTFGSIEIYGVFKEDFENSGIPDTVWSTMNERKLVDMPKHLTILYNTGMGELYCLNFADLNSYNEPKITSYYPGFPEKSQQNEVLYDNFGEFLLDMIQEEIE